MYAAPRIENISSFVRNPNTFLDALPEGPIHFTQRGKEAGVMIAPDEWREIVARLTRLELLEEHRANWAGVQDGTMRTYTQDELNEAVAQ